MSGASTSKSRRSRRRRRQLPREVGAVEVETTGLELPTRFEKGAPGATPGIELSELAAMATTRGEVRVTCTDYAPDHIQVQEMTAVDDFVASHRPSWTGVRWINVAGLSDLHTIRSLASKYDLQPLAIEDLLHVPQRPKVDAFAAGSEHQARLFVIVHMLQLHEDHLHGQQVSIFLGHHTVLTFLEDPTDIWDPIRSRLAAAGSRLRTNDASYLVYSLLDAIVDHCFPILEHYGDRLEELETLILESPSSDLIAQVHALKRELLLLRRSFWPLRDVVNTLHREPHECLSDTTRTYLRDVSDHTVQVIDIVETYREMATALTETYMTSVSTRLNEIMKVLTVIGTVFIPLTFFAGVWGMNFGDAMPETSLAARYYPWIYPVGFWTLCLATGVGLFAWFKRRGWL